VVYRANCIQRVFPVGFLIHGCFNFIGQFEAEIDGAIRYPRQKSGKLQKFKSRVSTD
jgi:hypothetical protein